MSIYYVITDGGGSPQMITDYIGGVWPNDYRLHKRGV